MLTLSPNSFFGGVTNPIICAVQGQLNVLRMSDESKKRLVKKGSALSEAQFMVKPVWPRWMTGNKPAMLIGQIYKACMSEDECPQQPLILGGR